MSLLPIFLWFENTSLGETIRASKWMFAVIESFHLVGLGLIGGAVLVVDLRLLGFGLQRHSVAELARDAQRWLIVSLCIMLPTGFLLFVSEAIKCYDHTAFWFKMSSLFLAMVFTFTIRRRVTMAVDTQLRPVRSKIVALISLALWTGVGVGGRWIGYS